MKTHFGKPLTKKEMKDVQGGKINGCAMQGQGAVAFSQGCCTGLSPCPGISQICEPPGNACFVVLQ